MLEQFSNADALALGLIAGFGFFALALGLDHPFIPLWDEGMHQAAARGTFDTPAYPHIYVEHLEKYDPRSYWISEVWLNKPPAPFWFAAGLMHLIGVTPLALRLGSLLGMLVAAVGVYLLGRSVAGRLFAAGAALLLLTLPFTWRLVQGLLFGDVTDCTLAGCNAAAIALLVYGVERASWRAYVAVGLVVGVGLLCKVMLAGPPLGVALGLGLLARIGRSPGPPLKWVAGMFAIAGAVALPWNVYAAARWPEPYWMHARTWLGHLAPVSGLTASIGSWGRPIDAIFNEINAGELTPVPAALTLLAGGWLLARAVIRKELITWALAIWLWSTWVMLSLSTHKVPAIAWGAVPAVVIALGLLLRDGLKSPALGFAALATLFTPLLVARWPGLSVVRAILPQALRQTRELPGLVEGLGLAAMGTLLGLALGRLLRGRRFTPAALAIPAALGGLVLLGQAHAARTRLVAENAPRLWASHTREVGLAIDRATPKKSVLYLDVERETPDSSDVLTQIFWSGRMTYRGAPGPALAAARSRGYHPYLLSPAAEAFVPVEGVPASASLRAYDLDRPTAAPAPIPEGVSRFSAQLDQQLVLGAASGPASRRHDRWAFYLRSDGPPRDLRVVFHTGRGAEELKIPAGACLREGQRLGGAAWFVLPALGPRRAEVRALQFDQGPKIPLGPG